MVHAAQRTATATPDHGRTPALWTATSPTCGRRRGSTAPGRRRTTSTERRVGAPPASTSDGSAPDRRQRSDGSVRTGRSRSGSRRRRRSSRRSRWSRVIGRSVPVYSTTSPRRVMCVEPVGVLGAHAGAAVGDVGVALGADRPRRGVDELAGVGHPHRPLDVVDVVAVRRCRVMPTVSEFIRLRSNFSMMTLVPERVVNAGACRS